MFEFLGVFTVFFVLVTPVLFALVAYFFVGRPILNRIRRKEQLFFDNNKKIYLLLNNNGKNVDIGFYEILPPIFISSENKKIYIYDFINLVDKNDNMSYKKIKQSMNQVPTLEKLKEIPFSRVVEYSTGYDDQLKSDFFAINVKDLSRPLYKFIAQKSTVDKVWATFRAIFHA